MVDFIVDSKPTNKKHITNLLKLADFLESDKIPPPRFDMGDWANEVDEESIDHWGSIEEALENRAYDSIKVHDAKLKKYATCNTVACAVGHGPLAGIKVYNDDNWWDYAHRVFGMDSGIDFEWLFGGEWQPTDNTPKGAAARIRIYIENGVPENTYEQQTGKHPLMYKKD